MCLYNSRQQHILSYIDLIWQTGIYWNIIIIIII
jgi:hypothetical protein